MSLFPILQPQVAEAAEGTTLPMAKEPAWDFENDKPIFRGGDPQPVTGAEAVRVWCYNAVRTMRRQWPCLSWNYGNDAESLIGKPYSEELKKAEATRYVKECLLASPYVQAVEVLDVSFEDTTISISARITTIYGEVGINV